MRAHFILKLRYRTSWHIIRRPKALLPLMVSSLTTNLVRDNIVSLNIIPHTAQVTNIAQHWLVGSKVNVEVDIVARYLERLLSKSQADNAHVSGPQSTITEAFLAENGFMK